MQLKTPLAAIMFFLGAGSLLVIASENNMLADWITTILILALLLMLFAFVGKEPVNDFNSLVERFYK